MRGAAGAMFAGQILSLSRAANCGRRGLRVGEMETSQGPWTGRGSKIENANCRQRGAEGNIFAGSLLSRVDFKRGRKLWGERGCRRHVNRVALMQGRLSEGSQLWA